MADGISYDAVISGCAGGRPGRVRTGVGGQKATTISERIGVLLVGYYTKTVKNLPRGLAVPAAGVAFASWRHRSRSFCSRPA